MADQNQIETIQDVPNRSDVNDHIQSTLKKYYKLSVDRKSLERVVSEAANNIYEFDLKNDKLGITSVSISSILSGRWIPAAFNNGRVFKLTNDKKLFIWINNKREKLTSQQVGRLIVNQLKVAFKDLELEIPEA